MPITACAKLELSPWKIERGARRRFAAHRARFANDEHDGVSGARRAHGSRDPAAVGCSRVAGHPFDVDFNPRLVSNIRRRRNSRLDPVENADCFFLPAITGPVAQHLAAIVRKRTDDRQSPNAGVERKDAVVAKKNHRPRRDLARRSAEFGRARRASLACEIGVRMIEQPGAKLETQDSSDGFVHGRERQLSLVHKAGATRHERSADHFHVHTGCQRKTCRICLVCRDAVFDQLDDGRVVGHDEAIELPLVAKNLGESKRVGRCRYAIQIVERAHERADARITRGLERREVHAPQSSLGYVDAVVVTPRFGGAVRDPVLRAGDHSVEAAEIVALESAYSGASHRGTKERIFAGPFRDASPTRIARDIDHRRERPLDAGGSCLPGGDCS
jgi:hypothetical protein